MLSSIHSLDASNFRLLRLFEKSCVYLYKGGRKYSLGGWEREVSNQIKTNHIILCPTLYMEIPSLRFPACETCRRSLDLFYHAYILVFGSNVSVWVMRLQRSLFHRETDFWATFLITFWEFWLITSGDNLRMSGSQIERIVLLLWSDSGQVFRISGFWAMIDRWCKV